MNQVRTYLAICAVLLFGFVLYVLAPVTREAIQGKPAPTPQPVTVPELAGTPSVAVIQKPVQEKPKSQIVASAHPLAFLGGQAPAPDAERLPNNVGTADMAPLVTKSKTISLMPGQAINIPNRAFRKVEIHSEYPLRVLIGPCHNDYTVEFFCDSEPADLFVADTRRSPIFLTPKANSVTITVTSY